MPPDDDALLNEELNWHALPRHRRPRLAGANAITAIALAIAPKPGAMAFVNG
jgi:hypothetical protein